MTRVAAAVAGLRYLANEPAWFIQLLDLGVLHDHLLRGLLHLHAQPPMFNLLIGMAEKIGGASYGALLLALQLALGLLAVLACYLTLAELDAPPSFCLVAGLLLLLNPAAVLYEFDPLYTELVFAAHCVIALTLTIYVRGRSRRALYALAALVVMLTLLRASYQWPWVLLIFGMLWWQMPAQRRVLARTALLAMVCACLWPAKNFVLFHHFTSSTWTSYSLSKHWDTGKPPVHDWVAAGELPTFALPAGTDADFLTWLKKGWPTPLTGVPELDDVAKQQGGAANWNSLTMLGFHDAAAKDISFLARHDSDAYLVSVGHGLRDYFEPSSTYFTAFAAFPRWHESAEQYRHLETIDRVVRRFCCNLFGFPRLMPDGNFTTVRSHSRVFLDNLQSLCLGSVLDYAVFFACVLSLRSKTLWRDASGSRTVMMVLCTTVLYAFAVVTLLEVGENMRYRFETHALVIVIDTVFLARMWRSRGVRRVAFPAE